VKISTGTPEDHPTPLPVDTSATPGIAPPTPVSAAGNEQGGVLLDISGVDVTAEASAAMAAGMNADADRRGRYAASMAPLGASAGDAMNLPPVPDNAVPPAMSDLYPFAGMEPTPAAAGWDYTGAEPGG
jgi:hypothetical protein